MGLSSLRRRTRRRPRPTVRSTCSCGSRRWGRRPYFTLDGAKVPPHLAAVARRCRPATSATRSPSTPSRAANRVERDVEVVRDQVTTELAAAPSASLDQFQLGVRPAVRRLPERRRLHATRAWPPATTCPGASAGRHPARGQVPGAQLRPEQGVHLRARPRADPAHRRRREVHRRQERHRRACGRSPRCGWSRLRAAAMLGVLLRAALDELRRRGGPAAAVRRWRSTYRVHKDVVAAGRAVRAQRPVRLRRALRRRQPAGDRRRHAGGAAQDVQRDASAAAWASSAASARPKFRAFLTLGWSPNFSDERRRRGLRRTRTAARLGRGHGRLPRRRRLPRPGQRRRRPAGRRRQVPADRRGRWTSSRTRTAAPRRTTTATASPTSTTPARTPPRTAGARSPRTAAPRRSEDGDGDGVPDASDKCTGRARGPRRLRGRRRLPRRRQRQRRHPRQLRRPARTRPRTPTGSTTPTAAPIPTTTRTAFNDAKDRCPAQPETLNGNQDDDGCPDPGAELVKLTDTRHRAARADQLHRPGRQAPTLTPAAQTLLNLVALVHARATASIDAAARSRSRRRGRQRATQARADAVVAFLVSKGVEADRAQGRGRGAGRATRSTSSSRSAPSQERRPDAPPSRDRADAARRMKTRGWATTDVGLKRDHNEDSYLCNDAAEPVRGGRRHGRAPGRRAGQPAGGRDPGAGDRAAGDRGAARAAPAAAPRASPHPVAAAMRDADPHGGHRHPRGGPAATRAAAGWAPR